MLPEESQFYLKEGALTPGGPHTWMVIDWDARSWIQVTGPAEILPDEDDGTKWVARYADRLGPGEHSFKISKKGDFLGTTDDDPTWEVRYPERSETLKNNHDVGVLRRSELVEVDRMHVCTDMVKVRKPDHDANALFAFKYTIIQERVKNIWNELHILNGIKNHPTFASLHSVIIDDVSEKVLGFTSHYVSGGTLEHYHEGPFYFRWLKQLTDAVDDLNLHFGIVHQDLAPRNVLIGPFTKDIKIFDFDRSALIGVENQEPGGNDVDAVIFTVYETLTKDEHYREVPWPEQNVSVVENMDEWKLQLPLEEGKGGIAAYRGFVSEWAAGRRTRRTIKHHSEATSPITWPVYTEPGPMEVTIGDITFATPIRHQKDAWKAGDHVTCWERPRQNNNKSQPLHSNLTNFEIG